MATMTKRRETSLVQRLAGNGWRVLELPRVPHEALEEFAREVWRLAFHAIPWPSGWGVRWGVLTNARGLCPYEAKLILLDEAWMLNDSPEQIVRTLVHEMAHLQHPREWAETQSHGPGFQETCDRATAFVLSVLEPERRIEPTAEPEPEAQVDEWEYR